MNKCLIAVEQPVTSGEQVTFQPAFALMLAQHLHHASLGSEKLIIGHGRGIPLPFGHFKHGS